MGTLPVQFERFRSAFAGRRVCVTGGAGFIGGHLIEALLSLGAEISVIDDLSGSEGSRLERQIDSNPGRIRFVMGSILDPRALYQAVAGCEVMFHQAAMVSVPRSVEEPLRSMDVNALGTARVAEACRASGVKRWVYAASSSAYGDDPAQPKVESMPARPISPYGVGKLTGELIVRAWARSYGLPGMSLRYFNIFGPHQPAEGAYAGVVAAFCRAYLKGEPPVIYGDGTNSRDFTPVANAVYANLLAAGSERELMGDVVNIGLGARITVKQLAEKIGAALGADAQGKSRPVHHEGRAGDVPHSQADIGEARRLIGYEPIVALDEGIAETVGWYRKGFGA